LHHGFGARLLPPRCPRLGVAPGRAARGGRRRRDGRRHRPGPAARHPVDGGRRARRPGLRGARDPARHPAIPALALAPPAAAGTAGPVELAFVIPVCGGGLVTRPEWFVIEDEAGWAGLEAGWRDLAERAAEPPLSASPGWTRLWWRHFGAGRRLAVAGARRDGALVALAPLCTTTLPGGIRVREFLGSEDGDWGGLLLAAGAESLAPDLTRVALEHGAWDLLDLWCVPAGSPAAEAFPAALRASGLRHDVTAQTVNPLLDIRSDSWAAGARRSMLKELARHPRLPDRH